MYRYLSIIVVIFLFSSFHVSAQMILNAEALRVNMLKHKNDWSGRVVLSFNYTKNTNDIYTINSNLALGYNGGKNLWMIISNLNFNKAEGVAFQNSGIQHLRYNRQLTKRFTWEAFLQGQYDGVFEIEFRGLAGSGVRFEMTQNNRKSIHGDKEKKQKSRIFVGSLIMYEYEKASEVEANIIRRDFRNSTYLSVSMFPTNQVTIVGTAYYQPRLDKLEDYRISSELNINIGFSSNTDDDEQSFWNRLQMVLSFSYNYDAFPVLSIPKTQYNISNGLIYAF